MRVSCGVADVQRYLPHRAVLWLPAHAALPYLRRFGARYRVAPAVWRLVGGAVPASAKTAGGADVVRYEGAVGAPLLGALQRAFSPAASFWVETDYHAGAYTSFWYDLAAPPGPLLPAGPRTHLRACAPWAWQ